MQVDYTFFRLQKKTKKLSCEELKALCWENGIFLRVFSRFTSGALLSIVHIITNNKEYKKNLKQNLKRLKCNSRKRNHNVQVYVLQNGKKCKSDKNFCERSSDEKKFKKVSIGTPKKVQVLPNKLLKI